jgi:hypothetical protein
LISLVYLVCLVHLVHLAHLPGERNDHGKLNKTDQIKQTNPADLLVLLPSRVPRRLTAQYSLLRVV